MSFETSFTDISGSNGSILIKPTQLFQWVIQSLHIDFQRILIILQNLLILNFNWYSELLGPWEYLEKLKELKFSFMYGKND